MKLQSTTSHVFGIVLFLIMPYFLCTGYAGNRATDNALSNKKIPVIVINTDVKFQTIQNFGASDAWTGQFVGLWPDAKRNRVADLLFSTETNKNGQPKGIGLSLWRFNIGTGSARQNNLRDEWKTTETFLNTDGTYDWTKQSGQRWLIKAAQKRGVNQFLGFTNSPPVSLTKNGKSFSAGGIHANLLPSNYTAFSEFLANVALHFQQEGIPLNYLSPFNEPQWDWADNKQEGCPYTNQEIYDITKKLDSLISAKKLNTKIIIGEAGKLNYLYEKADKAERGNQISEFFNQNSTRYLGAMANVEKSISAHSYFTTGPVGYMTSSRLALKNKLTEASIPLAFWQSEYCILGDQEEIAGSGKDLGMNTALYVARIIHYDLAVANASTWQWWLAVSVYDYKDGLIYIDKNKTDGKIEESKLLWAFGNFSRFIRPGSIRVGVTGENLDINNPTGLMVSSYVDNSNKKLVTVLINYGSSDVNYKVQVKGMKIKYFTPYITNDTTEKGLNPLTRIKSSESFVVPKRSIVTLVGAMN
ncbi:O-glycosyl hydrolase-like protein [Paludibacter propionicigenes WB4]|uniref:O-glycosyl hydrolase-like protein n=1 Tax=Paludibacter propionicigenes (strain DSM 17365 / JCM 13257 / WB4) TaxID=694427 RepID=E4T0V5_PALPW|nr:glycoside hydrolase [Paludibacter propionicigenes]ADQ78230.1 O-glycosyl hydrolase-like protein [Paludibacter propionicigenes WB4]